MRTRYLFASLAVAAVAAHIGAYVTTVVGLEFKGGAEINKLLALILPTGIFATLTIVLLFVAACYMIYRMGAEWGACALLALLAGWNLMDLTNNLYWLLVSELTLQYYVVTFFASTLPLLMVTIALSKGLEGRSEAWERPRLGRFRVLTRRRRGNRE